MDKKTILITNDDGIEASGIIRLARAVSEFASVWVVAPQSQRSAASHSISLHNPIKVYPHKFPVDNVKAFAVYGTPADCVRVGILGIMDVRPDMVFSGINYGFNAGTDVQYSATVGAAMEASFQGIAAVAFSEGMETGYKSTERYLPEILQEVMDYKHTFGEILNVNFPKCEASDVKGILRDRNNSRESFYRDEYIGSEIPGGMEYMVNGIHLNKAEEGSDMRALYDGYISIGTIRNIG